MWPSHRNDHSFAPANRTPWRHAALKPAQAHLDAHAAAVSVATAAAAAAASQGHNVVAESNNKLFSREADKDDNGDDGNGNDNSATIEAIIGRIIAAPAPELALTSHVPPRSLIPTSAAMIPALPNTYSSSSVKDKRFFEATKRFKTPAFMFFSAVKQKEIRKHLQQRQQPNDKTVNISKLVVKAWERLGPSEKLKWEALARQEKSKYEHETPLVRDERVPKISKPSSSLAAASSPKTISDEYPPARPQSAFLAFSNSRRASLQRDVMPNANYREVSKVLAVMWKEAPDAIRQHYFQEESERMKLYHAAMNKWKEQKSRDDQARARDKQQRWQPEQLVSLLKASVHANGKNVKDNQAASSTHQRAVEGATASTMDMTGTTAAAATASLQALHKKSPVRIPVGGPSLEALCTRRVRPGTAALSFEQQLAMRNRLDMRRRPSVALARVGRPGDLDTVAKILSRQQRLARFHHPAAQTFHLIAHPIPPLPLQPPLALFPSRGQALCERSVLRMNGVNPLSSRHQQQHQQQHQQPSHTFHLQESVKTPATLPASSVDGNSEFVFFPSPFSNPSPRPLPPPTGGSSNAATRLSASHL